MAQFAHILVDQFTLSRVLILSFEASHETLEYGAVAPRLIDLHAQTRLEMFLISTIGSQDTLLNILKQGRTATITEDKLSASVFTALKDLLPGQQWMLAPLCFQQQWLGVVALPLLSPMSEDECHILRGMLDAAAVLLNNANRHMQLRSESENALAEMQTFQQIDAELNDTIDLPYVFRMILDWALRFTRADTAILGLYEAASDVLEILVQYGYDEQKVNVGRILKQDGGVSLRVARQGKAAMIPDVLLDKDYYPTTEQTRSLLSVPILREDKVVAVMTLESHKLNGFTEEHLAFARKLASRAGVSVHNARLFGETQRERYKLALILRHIADIVMVLDNEKRVIMLNHSALQVFNLNEQQNYVGESLEALIPDSPLIPWLNTMSTQPLPRDSSLRLTNGRVYNVIMTQHPDIGRMIVLQDVTYFKEMDQLKSELVTTVTHDLKQPLSIMRGYLDLINLSGTVDERTKRYILNIEQSFNMMRQLIDDLLDMASLEAGIQLDVVPLSVNEIVQDCLVHFANTLEQKHQTLEVDLPELPLVEGDADRLVQVFQNLISNAIKYTPSEGHLRIWGTTGFETVQIHIRDSGIGISPEDQAHIFERFFRVRNAQTAKIEGTGLGLAIVRSLVEAHRGNIEVKSERGAGSTFTVSLPVYKVPPHEGHPS